LTTRAASLFSALHPDVYRHLLHLPLLSYSFFVPKKSRVKPGQEDGFPPVILIHGLGGSRGDLLPMECYLRLYGRKRIYRIDLTGHRSIESMSRSLARFLRRVLSVNNSPQVDIVAYSLGGIVARLALIDTELASNVRTLITMGTPHQGTVPARYMDTSLTRALHPESPTIQKLKQSRWPKGVRGVTFWSKNDLFIQPPDTASVRGVSRIDMSPFTHFSYLIDPKSWSKVQEILSK
jgi:triacylglycerol esterase/lipase EstA (alpha/beta hydrolase family)